MFGILVFVQFWLIKMISGNRLNKFDEYVDLNILITADVRNMK